MATSMYVPALVGGCESADIDGPHCPIAMRTATAPASVTLAVAVVARTAEPYSTCHVPQVTRGSTTGTRRASAHRDTSLAGAGRRCVRLG